MAALLLKQSFHQWKNDRHLDTLDIFLHCFQWHFLIPAGLTSLQETTAASTIIITIRVPHLKNQHDFLRNETKKPAEDCWYCSSLT